MKKQLLNVNHNYIRYANCWEDADVLLQALAIQPGDRVLSIGSAGDNSFSMLVNDPELVLAVDINPVQLQVIQLKKAAIKALDHDSFLQFMGFQPSQHRLQLYQQVKVFLSKKEKTFWETHQKDLASGIIYCGKFERYFKIFHSKILPFIHTPEKVKKLLSPKSAQQQQKFFQQHWNTWRWKLLFKVFFSKFIMGWLGRDPQFLKEVKVPVSNFILSQAEEHLCSIDCQNNYFLQFILTGTFGVHLPHYARKVNFEVIKNKIDRLVVFHGLAEDTLKKYKAINKFNLSNIFEYMNPTLFLSVCQNLVNSGSSGSRYVYWNLMVPRKMSEVNTHLVAAYKSIQLLNQKDKGFFYSTLNLEIKK